MRVIAATQNHHKVKEIDAITKEYGLHVVARDEAGVPPFAIEETGDTFEANSLLKALAIHRVTGEPTIADDSGIEVDALDGRPGVLSARFAGTEGDDAANNEKLLDLLAEVPWEQRTARFVSVVTLVFGEEDILVARGECPGRVAWEPAGSNGFGYDPLFVPSGYGESFGELGPDVKNKISHRARALRELARLLAERT